MPAINPESTRASQRVGAATAAVSRIAPQNSSRPSRHSSTNKGAERYETDHPPAATMAHRADPDVTTIVRAPEDYASSVKSARNPTRYASKHDTTGHTSRYESHRTSTGTHTSVPVSALTAKSSHSTRRDSSSRRDTIVESDCSTDRYGSTARAISPTDRYTGSMCATPPGSRHGSDYESSQPDLSRYSGRAASPTGRHSSNYSRATPLDDLEAELNYPYSGSSAYRGESSRYADHSDASTYRGSTSTALSRHSSRHGRDTGLTRHTSTKLSDIPESSHGSTLVKDYHKSGRKGMEVNVAKGANVVVNVYNAPVINQKESRSKSKRK